MFCFTNYNCLDPNSSLLELFPKVVTQDGHRDTLQGKFLGDSNMLVLNGHAWKSQRKVANPAFHRSMPVKLFGKLTQDMFKVMDDMGETIVITDLLERWTLDAIGKAGFGKKKTLSL